MYLDLVMDKNKCDVDENVDFGYEKGTVQSYFTPKSIREFIGDEAEILEFKIITWNDEAENEINRRAHLIIRRR
jgi:hypothetical protein